MSFPVTKSGSGAVVGLYRLGRYTCMLIRDSESIGPIKYVFMLVVTEQGSKAPTVVVTCEHNEMQSELLKMAPGFDEEARKELLENAPKAYFCFFDQQGDHHVVEPFESIPDADAFGAKAFALAASKLGVSDAPVLLNSSLAGAMGRDKRPLFYLGGAITIVVGVVLYAFLQQPKNADDCILKGMAGVTNDVAALAVRQACRNKFPKHDPDAAITGGNPYGDPQVSR